MSVRLRRRGGNISVDFALIVLLYNTNFMNKLKFNDLFKIKNLKLLIYCKKNIISTKSPYFPLRGKVGQLRKEEESALLVYLQYYCIVCVIKIEIVQV